MISTLFWDHPELITTEEGRAVARSRTIVLNNYVYKNQTIKQICNNVVFPEPDGPNKQIH